MWFIAKGLGAVHSVIRVKSNGVLEVRNCAMRNNKNYELGDCVRGRFSNLKSNVRFSLTATKKQ